MDIIWDTEKNDCLQVNRSISFEGISGRILEGNYINILENPTRDNQIYFIININNYTWVVPFFIDDQERILTNQLVEKSEILKSIELFRNTEVL